MNLDNKNIVLTGASSGIGLELLKLIAGRQDIKIVAVARHIENIPEKEGIIFPFKSDMSTPEGIDLLFDYCKSLFGHIDIFIANAGYAYLEKLGNPDWKHIENIFSLNTFSPIYSLQKLAIQKSEKETLFVSTASAVSMVSLPYYSLYCSTKAALHRFMETYRYEARNKLRVMTVYPVATRTPFFEKAADTPQPPLPFPTQSPGKVASAILKGIKKNKKQVYPSLLFRIFDITARLFPVIRTAYSWNEKRKVRKILNL